MTLNITENFNLPMSSGILTTLKAGEKICGSIKGDDGKLRLNVINYFNHSSILTAQFYFQHTSITLGE